MNFRKLLPTLVMSLSLLAFTSCGKNPAGETSLEIPGVDGPKVSLVGDQVLISVVFEEIQIEGGLRYPIPKYDNSHIEVSPDFESDGTLMVFAIDLDDVFGDKVKRLDAQTLPGGRALPGVASGKLPAVAFSIPQWHNISLYLGPKLFGVFVPVKLGMEGAMLTARYYIEGNRSGNISLIGEDENNDNSGFLLMLDLNKTVQKQLKRVARNN